MDTKAKPETMGEAGQVAVEATTAPEQVPAEKGSEAMPIPKSTSPAFQFYPKDFLTSPKVRRMSLTERGAYITLLSLCWLDGSLPNDPHALASELHIPFKQFERMWSGALSECFTDKDGRLFNDRLIVERKKQLEFKRRQTDAAERRWEKERHKRGNATALVRDESGNASRSLSPICDLQTTSLGTCAETPSVSPPEPALLDFQTDGKDRTWALTQSRVDGWASAYPSLDVLGECRKAQAWLMANPERRKTAKGMPSFLVNWLNRAVAKGGQVSGVRTYSRLPEWAQ